MTKYGFVYQGSKSKIADNIINILPRGNRFVDLFGGGFAISHCAILCGKYKSVLFNEINSSIVDLIQKSINGYYSDENRWIDKIDFKNLKEKEGYIKYVWSFSCGGKRYLYGETLKDYKKALHFLYFFNDNQFFQNFGVTPPIFSNEFEKRKKEISKFIKRNAKEIRTKYIKYIIEKYDNKELTIEKVENIIKNYSPNLEKEKLFNYLNNALKESGLTSAEVSKKLKTNMNRHYFEKQQFSFPTFEMYKKLQEIIPLKEDYFEITNFYTILNNLKFMLLNDLNDMSKLSNLARLENLKRLEKLKPFLDKINFSNDTYKNYVYEKGDIVYCDPPYENTSVYNNTNFNHKEFYDWVASREYQVWFSSYDISDNRFYVVEEFQKQNLMSGKGNGKTMIEKIYTNKNEKFGQLSFNF